MKSLLFFLFCTSLSLGFSQDGATTLVAEKQAYFYGSAHVGCALGDAQAITVNTGWGYHFQSGLETGLSIGRERYNYTYAPIFIETNYGFRTWKSGKPFAGIFGGVLLNTSPYETSRSKKYGCIGARIGFTRYLTDNLGWTTSLGYRFMQLGEPNYYTLLLDEFSVKYTKINNHVIELRIGLELR